MSDEPGRKTIDERVPYPIWEGGHSGRCQIAVGNQQIHWRFTERQCGHAAYHTLPERLGGYRICSRHRLYLTKKGVVSDDDFTTTMTADPVARKKKTLGQVRKEEREARRKRAQERLRERTNRQQPTSKEAKEYPYRKLSAAEVITIRRSLSIGGALTAIAHSMRVPAKTVIDIRDGRAYAWVTDYHLE